MKILNLFAGIGGNRTLWGDTHEITAVENNQQIAMIYLKRFPKDKVIIGDAYEYLEKHYDEFDFIWASPPCTTHTQLQRWAKRKKLPDIKLYSIIIFLSSWCKGYWCVENVIPYYHAIIPSTAKIGRHLVWSNFKIENMPYNGREIPTGLKFGHASKLSDVKPQETNDKMNPLYGKHILDSIPDKKQLTLEIFK